MSIVHITEATPGAPNSGRMSGTAGDLYAMLKFALPLNGWSVEYDDPVNFGAVFRPGSGNRFRLFVLDNATASGDARLALVRGCENASSATTSGIVDPFPTVAKVPNTSSNWLKSTAATTTARNFDIYVGTTWVLFFCNVTGTTNAWDIGLFGDWFPTLPGDPYCTACAVRNTTSAAGVAGPGVWGGTTGTLGAIPYSFARSYDGTLKSTTGAIISYASGPFGTAVGPPAQLGPSTGIDREKMVAIDTGTITTAFSTSISLPKRAYVPNLWLPLHAGSGSVNSRDTFTDTAYNPSSTFKVFTNNNSATSGFVIVEETDTWSPPSG